MLYPRVRPYCLQSYPIGRSAPGSSELPGLLLAFSDSVDAVFYLLGSLAVVSFIAAWGMGWVDTRKKAPAKKRA